MYVAKITSITDTENGDIASFTVEYSEGQTVVTKHYVYSDFNFKTANDLKNFFQSEIQKLAVAEVAPFTIRSLLNVPDVIAELN